MIQCVWRHPCHLPFDSMILLDGDHSACPVLEDVITMDGQDEHQSSAASSPRPDNGYGTTSSKGNGNKTPRGKKRVQFLPDGILVRIRVIPPRSNKSSDDSDDSASDSSDSDNSDSETVTDSEDFSSDRDTPSPAIPTESKNKFVTMPPLVYAAKGSYTVSKSSNKNGILVAKITGINRPTSPSSQSSTKTKKTKRIGSPKMERVTKKNVKQNERNENSKRPMDDNKNKGRRKRTPLKFKEGKISPPPPARSNRNNTALKPSVKLSQRRTSNTTNTNKTTLSAKRPQTSFVSTSVKPLSTPSPSTSPDMSLERVSRAMQSLTMGKLYTVDGFIFPPHHANELHLPDLALTSKSEEYDQSSGGNASSPRRSIQGNIHHQMSQSQTQISPTSANRKRRYYAWQMANGSIQNTLSNTPNISQLWDNVSVHSDSMDKKSLNVHKQM